MWRNNVLRLRSGPSAFLRGARLSRCYSERSTERVSDEEFMEAWEELYPRARWSGSDTVGLAISGGVDSMALATLYTRALERNTHFPQCHAIIVDHKVRPESAEEANWTAEHLRAKCNIRSTIVPIKWPGDVDPHDTNRFESVARMLRYQALGRTCRDHGISSLLCAHHGDDQAETVLMRLMDMRLRSGLSGMKARISIPECYGVHGVHHSAVTDTNKVHRLPPNLPFPIETGGVEILRPLLKFEKTRLIATCEATSTAWVEDKTNAIPTYTNRNAVRYLMKEKKLPEAFSTSSLVALSQRMRHRLDEHERAAEALFNSCLLKLDIQLASLVVRFPSAKSILHHPIVSESDRIQARNTVHLLLRRVASLVSPKEELSFGAFSKAVDCIYPTIREDPSDPHWGTVDPGSLTSFSVGGVWFRVWDNPTPFDSAGSFPRRVSHEWVLSRQPMDYLERKSKGFVIPPSSVDPAASATWSLVDGRFWLRLQNETRETYSVRAFVEQDFQSFHTDAQHGVRGDYSRVRAAFAAIKPFDLRRGIPAIFRIDEQGKEVLVALPSLNVWVRNEDISTGRLVWDLRYKKIELGGHKMEDVVVRGITERDLEHEIRKGTRKSPQMTMWRKARREMKIEMKRVERRKQQGTNEGRAQRDPSNRDRFPL